MTHPLKSILYFSFCSCDPNTSLATMLHVKYKLRNKHPLSKRFLLFERQNDRLICHRIITVCCKGRSKKYRKWDFWGCSLSETRQWIDIKFGRDDYVGDESQYPKWHSNRFRGMISTKGWNVNGLCFFICCLFFSAARGQTVGPILTSDTSKCVFLGELHSLWG